MAKKRVGRPAKIDKDTMKDANLVFLIIIIILILLLSMTIITAFNPEIFDMIKASITNLFK
ncbi:MAG: hypothetical protein U0M66_04155 [Bacilli bacterium]|nr:hypothetical protein [Bacilli bacterium]